MSINEPIQNRFGMPTESGKTTTQNKTLTDIQSHRSGRDYKPYPIPEDLVQTLFAAAFSAPSKSDLQQACVIRVESLENNSVSPTYPLIHHGLPLRHYLWFGVATVGVFDGYRSGATIPLPTIISMPS